MKRHNILFILCMSLLIVTIAGCKGKKEKAKPEETEFEQAMSSKDTLAVEQLIDTFFGYVENKQFGDAVLMLYRNDTNEDGSPVELNNEEMAEVRSMLESIPMVGYKIEYIKFNEYYANEVKCNVIIREAEGDMPAITTKMFFKPVNYLGNWVLCLTNTEYGDRRIVDPSKSDSMTKAFQEQNKETSESKNNQ